MRRMQSDPEETSAHLPITPPRTPTHTLCIKSGRVRPWSAKPGCPYGLEPTERTTLRQQDDR